MKFYDDLGSAMENLTSKGAFLTVKDESGTVNTMTIAWGYVGFSWNKPYFVAMIRPQRYTIELITKADSFTISIPYTDNMKKALAICGSKSGRDVDKEAEAGISFVDSKEVASPIVDGCNMYYECKMTYTDKIHPELLPAEISEKNYIGDCHNLYYGEIIHSYKK